MNRWPIALAVASWVLFSSFDKSINEWQSVPLDMYYNIREADFPPGADVVLWDCNGGGIIANVSNDFYTNLTYQGSGQLRNLSQFVTCDTDECKCVDKGSCGFDAAGNCLSIYRDVGSREWNLGTILFVKEFDKFKLPNGETHNGCVQVVDNSSGVSLPTVQWYVGSQQNFNDLQTQFMGTVTIQENSPCHLQSYNQSNHQTSKGPNSPSGCTLCTKSTRTRSIIIGNC
ncbi:hypothetical protein O6H91_Y164800 [Diphasiastrum complanatum]|nr:hypothetical protein O6H91_Y164800 [Diphasiastrum complanatum]